MWSENGTPRNMADQLEPQQSQAKVDPLVRFLEHIKDSFDERFNVLDKKIDGLHEDLLSAVPDKDLKGHHDFHKAKIDDAKERADWWRDLRRKFVVGGLYGAGAFIALAVWESFKSHLK